MNHLESELPLLAAPRWLIDAGVLSPPPGSLGDDPPSAVMTEQRL